MPLQLLALDTIENVPRWGRDPVDGEPLPVSFCSLLHVGLKPLVAIRAQKNLINAFVSPRPSPNFVP